LLWLVRVGVAMGVMLPYEAIYRLDATVYYSVGIHLSEPWSKLAFGEGTDNIISLVGILSAFTESYSGIKLVFAYIGLVAVYIFYRAACLALGREMIDLLFLMGLFPSILFWSSILGKDPITLLGIGIFCYGAAGLIGGRGWMMLIYIAAGLAIAAFIRIWLGVVFLSPLVAAMVLAGRSSVLVKAGFLLVMVPLFMISLQGFAEKFSLETAGDLVSRTDEISQAWAYGGSAQQIEGGFGSLQEMILFIPFGAFTALFRPLPGEILNAFGTLAGLENAVLLWLIASGILRRGLGWLREPTLLWAVLTLVAWSSIYGFASYQNLGTAFRFHVQIAPILLLLGLYLSFSAGRSEPPAGSRARASDSAAPAGEEVPDSRG
jgi:hypothetical protein